MSNKWLDKLEAQIQKTSTQVRTLRADNDRLKEQVEALEARIAEGAETGADTEAAEAWQAEREAIRDRVQALSDRLESLLESDAETPSE